MATLIAPDGSRTDVAPATGPTFTLEELQKFVGGWIQIIAVGRSLYVLNEEGKLHGLPINATATYLAHDFLFAGDWLCGSVLICAPEEMD